MKRSILIGVVAVVGVCVGWMFANSSKQWHLQAAGRPVEVKTTTTAVADGFASADSARSADISADVDLQRRIAFSKQRADELGQPGLTREVEALHQQLKELKVRQRALENELTGWRVAAEATRTLEMIVEKVPNTKAAEAAAAAIQLIHERRVQAGSPQPTMVPAHSSDGVPATPAKPGK